MLKITLSLLVLISLNACTSVDYPEEPSYIKEITLEDGRVIQEYHKGYDREDFLKEFYGYSKKD